MYKNLKWGWFLDSWGSTILLRRRSEEDKGSEFCFKRKQWDFIPTFMVDRLGTEAGSGYWRIHLSWLFFECFVPICRSKKRIIQFDDDPNERKYGFYSYGGTELWVWYGTKYKVFRYPYVSLEHETRIKLDSYGNPTDKDISIRVPYRYVLKNGTVQETFANVSAVRSIYKRKWWPVRKVFNSIWVEFEDEIGEGSGSWKGGTVGCGYDLFPGENTLQCLRRMESERKFR